MTEPSAWSLVAIAAITAVPPTLVAYLGWKSTHEKLAEVHVLVNSEHASLKADLASAKAEILVLQKLMANKLDSQLPNPTP